MILLAGLRGLLKPTYEQGVASILRENLMIDLMEAEMETSAAIDRMHIDAAFAMHFKPQAIKTMLSQMRQRHKYLYLIKEMDSSGLEWLEHGRVDALLQLYHALEKAGIIVQPDKKE